MTRGRGRLGAVAAAALVLGVVAAPLSAQAAPAGHHHHRGPSAHDVAASKAAVARRERQVRAAAGRIERGRSELARLAAAAEVAVESYDRARLAEQAAERDLRSATFVLHAAADRVAASRRQVARFAAAAYMSGGLSTMDALLDVAGPQALIDRVGAIQAISTSQRDAVQSLSAAQVYELTLARHARVVADRARRLTSAAARARGRAQAAVGEQTSALATLRHRQQHLTALLQHARHHASAVERARLAEIARERAAAAARARARQAAAARQAADASTGVAATGTGTAPVTGTVSAATEQRAVSEAESQLGKPYQWGAAGPDSYDCSGLVMWAYGRVGVHLDHWTGYQWQEGAHIPTSSVRPGDLLFFATDTSDPDTIHHVGIYVGNGEMVEAPYTGADVRISSAWRPDLIGVVRPYAR